MKFIDEATITVQSGNGGRGCVSFRREKFIPRGGPDGGDGGKGGDVILTVSPQKRTLYDFRYKNLLKAKNGSPGQGKNKSGKSGTDLIIEVPAGTVVTDAETGQIIKDFIERDEIFVVAKGGRGGQGNARFKTSTHRTPRFAQPGEPGETRSLVLELKLLADVGIIGLPNAGKSTLINAISSARSKTGEYPFTTLTPSLGVVSTPWAEPFVVADIPGLIEGAHTGTGLGLNFLKHIERTRILIHLIDISEVAPDNPLENYHVVCRELSMHDKKLAEKPQIVVLNKLDIAESEQAAERFRSAAENLQVLTISAKTGKGLEKLTSRIVQLLDQTHAE